LLGRIIGVNWFNGNEQRDMGAMMKFRTQEGQCAFDFLKAKAEDVVLAARRSGSGSDLAIDVFGVWERVARVSSEIDAMYLAASSCHECGTDNERGSNLQ